MDKWQRRKVWYRTADKPDFDPYKTAEEKKKELEDSSERPGWFHTWTHVSEEDTLSDQILIKAYGVVEAKTGELLELPVRWFRYADENE